MTMYVSPFFVFDVTSIIVGWSAELHLETEIVDQRVCVFSEWLKWSGAGGDGTGGSTLPLIRPCATYASHVTLLKSSPSDVALECCVHLNADNDLLISFVCSAGRSCIVVIETITSFHWLYTSSCKMSIEPPSLCFFSCSSSERMKITKVRLCAGNFYLLMDFLKLWHDLS